LESGNDRLQGVIHISGSEEMEPVEMNVEIFQRDFYRLDQYIVSMSKEASETTTIQISPAIENDKIKISELKSDVDFIKVDTDENNGANDIVLIKLDKEKEIKTGYYTISAKLENSKGRKNLALITINITP
jgi:hypothetical protein